MKIIMKMDSQINAEHIKLGGCTARATNKFSKTAQATRRHASQRKATHNCCLGGSDNKGSKQSTTSNSKKISSSIRQSTTNLLLIAAMTLATLAQQQQIAAGYKLPEAELTAAALSASSSSSSSSSAESSVELPHLHSSIIYDQGNSMRRTRLRKRHSNHLYFDSHLHESATHLEWQNPCGGFYDPMHDDDGNAGFGHHEILPLRFYIKPLRLSTRQEYRTLNETLHAIDISDIEMWRSHKPNYKFLPNLKRNSSIALKRWYRNMQTYVAAFAYLGRTQYKWDHSKLMYTSQTTKELNELLLSARRILCEIETAINGSFPHDSRNKLNVISREEMNRRLHFRTRRHATDALVEADKIDMKFTKYSFYDFLSTMWKVLRKNSKRRGQVALHQQRESSDQLQSEENASMSLRAISAQSASSSSASESFELIEDISSNKNRNHGRRHANRHASGGHKLRSHKHHAQLPELNEV